MKEFLISIVLMVFAGVWTTLPKQVKTVENASSSLPSLVFLGQGPATYTVPAGFNFIIKQQRPFRFEWMPGPIYTATSDEERVWQSSGVENLPPAVYHDDLVIGPVEPGCVIEYVAIDDDVDDRINHFLVDGNVVHTLPQGMAVEGEFIINQAGTLSYESNDSTGMYLSVCERKVALTPTPGPPATATPAGPDEPVAIPTPEPTQEPQGKACLRINFEVSGDVARAGHYVVQEVGGRTLATWYAQEGWQDSGWITEIDISFPSVHIQVLYYPDDGSEPIMMRIVNPAPDKPYGWLSRGICHAIEVAWP